MRDATSENAQLKGQIEETLSANGFPLFPPVYFTEQKPPYLLVISPRNRIEYTYRTLLTPSLNNDDMETLENDIFKLGFSGLVVELSGFGGTYPPVISDGLQDRQKAEIIIEEWFHQYLAFRPLGFLYLLDSIGLRKDPEIVTINETLAGIFSSEIVSGIFPANIENNKQGSLRTGNKSSFDFDLEMRETRRTLELYLEKGEIGTAEEYLAMRRKYFIANGYYIRKLNQAYFAFHGIYGQDPASVSPLFQELTELRKKYDILKVYIDDLSTITALKDIPFTAAVNLNGLYVLCQY